MTKTRRRQIAAAVALVIIAAAWSRPRPDDITMRFFNVGQGDAAMVSIGRTQVLIDAGPDRTILGKLGRAMPFFDHRIELAVLTHPHADHFLGFSGVFERYDVARLLVSAARNDSSEYRVLVRAAEKEGTEIIVAGPGDTIELAASVRLKVLWSGREPEPQDLNDASVVLRLETPGGAALFMGDAGTGIERSLMAAGASLRADVLKVGHHGSRTSTGAAFLDAVRPEKAIVSVGKNRYGHPSFAVLERLKSMGARVRRTDRDGDITVKFRRPP